MQLILTPLIRWWVSKGRPHLLEKLGKERERKKAGKKTGRKKGRKRERKKERNECTLWKTKKKHWAFDHCNQEGGQEQSLFLQVQDGRGCLIQVWGLSTGGALGAWEAAPERMPSYIFWLALAIGLWGSLYWRNQTKVFLLLLMGIHWFREMPWKHVEIQLCSLRQPKKPTKLPVVLHQPWPKISIFLGLFNNQVPFSPFPPKEKKHICSRLLEIKRAKTCMYGFLSFSYTECQGHGNTRLRGLE